MLSLRGNLLGPFTACLLICAASIASAQDGVLPKGADGRALNLDFETGTLDDWQAEGEAFAGALVEGDTVSARRGDMASQHQGKCWVGGYEKKQDAPKGTLTSATFEVTHPYAAFLMNGGSHPQTRVELVDAADGRIVYRTSGTDLENLRRFVVDLRKEQGKKVFVRLVDDHSGGWGHVNFDDFRFYEKAPAAPTPPAAGLVADEYPHAGLTAEEAAKAMRLPEGFRAIVSAAEPDVQQPIAIAIDDRGRVWIAEAFEYPRRAEEGKGRDRILIFEDTNGDGAFDSRKVFAEGLNLVSGLEIGFGGVWVGAAPYLLFIPDANGDDVPDAEPTILLDGWHYEDTHETLNAFIWGPDGWLYGCHGVFTHSNVGKPGTPENQRQPINAGVWRYHPTQHEFEVFAHGTSNPWGVDFNDRGEAFITACVIPHLYHVIPGGRYQRQAGSHFNAHTYDDLKTIADHRHYLGASPHGGNSKSDEAGGGHAHAGAMIYLGGKWPAEYRGSIFMNNIHGQRLNVDVLKPNGSGYVGGHGPDFLLTGDRASQILNVRYGPDGDAYMIDWYDMQACHDGNSTKHDRTNGRIYKIVQEAESPKTVTPQNDPALELGKSLAERSDVELARLALSENDWYVRHSRRVLQERAEKRALDAEAANLLIGLAQRHPDETRRLRGLWALHVGSAPGSGFEQALTGAMEDSSPAVRGWAIRMLAERERPLSEASLDRLRTMARDDDSPVVRLAIASALQKVEPARRWDVLTALAAHGEDAADHNLPLMIWYAAEPLAEVDPERALAFGISVGDAHPKVREFMLRRIGSGDPDASLALLVRGLGKANDAALRRTFLGAIDAALRGRRDVQPPADWPAVHAKLKNDSESDVRLHAMAVAVALGDAEAMKELRRVAASADAPVAERRFAIERLLAANDAQLVPLLLPLITREDGPELRLVALRGLARFDSERTPDAVLAAYAKLPPDAKQAALASLSSRAAWGKVLLAAVADGRVAATDLSSDLVRQLQLHGDAAIDQALAESWGTVRATPEEKAKLIAEYAALHGRNDLSPPDAELGRAIFARTCQRCHVLYGVGGNVGPDLTGSNRANLDYLLSNIVDPSAVMAKEYRQTTLLLSDGRVLVGIVKAEDPRTVTLRTADAEVVVPVADIEVRRGSDASMMPDDQLRPFDEHAIRSLIAYLSAPKQTAMLADEQNAPTLFDGESLAGWSGDKTLWSVENGEIVGKSSGLAHNAFLVSDLAAENFRLTLEAKLIDDAGNSGIQFRSEPLENGEMLGYQADMGPGWWGKLFEESGRGLLWDKSGEAHVRKGEWNRYEIVAHGDEVRTFLNGEPCVDLRDPQGRTRGVFGLQLHSGGPTEVRFRNLKLELLDAEPHDHEAEAAGE